MGHPGQSSLCTADRIRKDVLEQHTGIRLIAESSNTSLVLLAERITIPWNRTVCHAGTNETTSRPDAFGN
jgi:hypothetical protein